MCPKCAVWLNNSVDICKSPMLHHLNDAEHENVTLRNDVKVGKTAVECGNCGFKNDLIFGFAAVESHSIAVVLSRQTDEPCNKEWKELTDEIQVLSFMVKIPGTTSKKAQSENRICIPHTSVDVCAVICSAGSQDSGFSSRFANGAEYAEFFGRLEKLEAEHQKYLTESLPQVDIKLRWEDLNGKVIAKFIMVFNEAVSKPQLGEKLRLRLIGNRSSWTGVGRVVKLPKMYDEEVSLEMETNADIPRNHTAGFSVSRVWISISYDRKISALQKFNMGTSNDQNLLFNQILGNYVENASTSMFEWNNFKLHPVSCLPPLSAQQESVVKKAMQPRLTLLQGPSASGKTITLLSILYHFVLQNKGPILVCAQTNNVVDHLASIIHRMKLEVVRLFAHTRPSLGSRAQFLSLESKIRNNLPMDLRKLSKSFDNGDELSAKDAKKLREWKKKAERNILEDADVICCTCIAAGDERLSSMKFHAILIDESMQATEAECIIPISLGCEHLVLVGDHLQLAPVIKNKKALDAGLGQSLFQRLVNIGVEPLEMTAQYRMHPKLWHFPSTFYTGSLPSGVSAAQRTLPDHVLPWPNSDFPFMFYDVRSFDERSWPIKSYINKAEASKVEQMVTRLLKRGITPDRIGVLTQYMGQKEYLKLHMEQYGCLDTDRYRAIEVDLVDAFQGREKDIIIISCVRSLGNLSKSSLNHVRRFHLALTRAKYGLVIVGNSVALSKIKLWNALLNFCRQHGVMVEGELDDLKPSSPKFSQQHNSVKLYFEDAESN